MPRKPIIILSSDEEEEEIVSTRARSKKKSSKQTNTGKISPTIVELKDEIEEFPSPKRKSRKRSNSSNQTQKTESTWFTKKKRKSEETPDVSHVVNENDEDDLIEIKPKKTSKRKNKTTKSNTKTQSNLNDFVNNNNNNKTQQPAVSKFFHGSSLSSQIITSKNNNNNKVNNVNNNDKFTSPYFTNNNGSFQTTKTNSQKYKIAEREEVWAQKYAPETESDLSINKKKLEEVKFFLQNAIENLPKGIKNTPKILVLTGPCGAGKTAMIQILAKNLKVELSEWIEPSLCIWKDADENLLGAESRIKKFKDFMLRSERYSSIIMTSDLKSSDDNIRNSSDNSLISRGKIIMIEQLPYLHDDEHKNVFFSILRDFLHSSVFPLVIILSDDNNGNSNLHNVLPTDVISSYLVKIIPINKVALSTIGRILKSIRYKEGLSISDERLQVISELSAGDLRSAINTLQFYSISKRNLSQPSSNGSQNARKNTKKSKKIDSSPSDKNEIMKEKKLGLLGTRDLSISLFHGLGKILYNKRLSLNEANIKINTVVPNTSPFYRLPLNSNPEKIMSSLSISTATFNTFLHENYLRFFENIDDVANAALYLSDSDILDTSFGYLQKENTRLSSYVGLTSTRGLLYSNTHPISLKTFQQMYKPQSIRYYQKKLDFNNAIDKIIVQSPTPKVKENDVFTNPSVILRTEILPFISKVRNLPDLKLTSGQTSLLDSLCTFYSSSSIEKLDKVGVVEDNELSDSSIPAGIISRNWFAKHHSEIQNREQTSTLLSRVGGRLNEVLEEDDIVDD